MSIRLHNSQPKNFALHNPENHIDLSNYKGMFYGDEPGQKNQDETTGAHFKYDDMCQRLLKLQKELYNTQKARIFEEKDEKKQFKIVERIIENRKTRETRNETQVFKKPNNTFNSRNIKLKFCPINLLNKSYNCTKKGMEDTIQKNIYNRNKSTEKSRLQNIASYIMADSKAKYNAGKLKKQNIFDL